MKTRKVKIAISSGDINGIGLEIIIKSFLDDRIFNNCTPLLYVNPSVLKEYNKSIPNSDFTFHTLNGDAQINTSKLNVIPLGNSETKIHFRTPTPESGQSAYDSLERSTLAIRENEADVLVTAPITKQNIRWVHKDIKGHTEYLAHYTNEDNPLMMMVHDSLRVGVVTAHIPIRDVAQQLTRQKIIDTLTIFRKSLIQDFNINQPLIAVLGLNPHAGDNGVIGREEIDIIIPAIEAFNIKHKNAMGPFPSDGFFGTGQYQKFDGVLAMYHDQGLIPFKTISKNEGVNFTAGLSIIRTSPDHGTAFDIAGKNMADPSSFRNAIYLAMDIFNNRKIYSEITQDVLSIKR